MADIKIFMQLLLAVSWCLPGVESICGYIHICEAVCVIARLKIIFIVIVNVKNSFKSFNNALICNLILLNHSSHFTTILIKYLYL
jgi:hypothetical protein